MEEKLERMDKKERFQAVREKRAPDYMPVYSRVTGQMIYGAGLMMPDITGQDWYDSETITQAVLSSIKDIGYDIAIPAYLDCGSLGLPPLGGSLNVPDRFGVAVTPSDDKPVKTKADWPKVKKMLEQFDVKKTDPRMKGAREVIKNVSMEVGDDVPLVAVAGVGTQTAMFLFRPPEAFLNDMLEDPEWVDEMCHVATNWVIKWIRAQYEAGANSVASISEGIASAMVSPEMCERFNLENIARVVETVKKEFNQGTWLHLHGNMTTPKAYKYLTKLATDAGVEGFHLDELNPPDWIKENLVDKLGVSACIVTHGGTIVNGPVEKIEEEVKAQISECGDGLGIMMSASCEVLPATSNEQFKAWVDATHKYGKYPLNHKKGDKN